MKKVAYGLVGLIVLLAVANIGRDRQNPGQHLKIIAAGYLIFDAVAWLVQDLKPHFLLFVATGLLIGAFATRLR